MTTVGLLASGPSTAIANISPATPSEHENCLLWQRADSARASPCIGGERRHERTDHSYPPNSSPTHTVAPAELTGARRLHIGNGADSRSDCALPSGRARAEVEWPHRRRGRDYERSSWRAVAALADDSTGRGSPIVSRLREQALAHRELAAGIEPLVPHTRWAVCGINDGGSETVLSRAIPDRSAARCWQGGLGPPRGHRRG